MAAPMLNILAASVRPNLKNGRGNSLSHPLGVMKFGGTVHGVQVKLNGTVQEIHDQFASLYPEIVARHGKANDTISTRNDIPRLGRRNKHLPPLFIPVRGQWWYTTAEVYIRQGIRDLESSPGRCGVDAKSCVSISCSDSSDIYLCNDNYYRIQPACNYLGSYAQDIFDHCQSRKVKVLHVGGQEFDMDNYNVIVREGSC